MHPAARGHGVTVPWAGSEGTEPRPRNPAWGAMPPAPPCSSRDGAGTGRRVCMVSDERPPANVEKLCAHTVRKHTAGRGVHVCDVKEHVTDA